MRNDEKGREERDPRELLPELARQRGASLKALSVAIGRNHAYLQQFCKKGKPRRLSEDDREALGAILNVDPEIFRTGGPRTAQEFPSNARLDRNVPMPLAYGLGGGVEVRYDLPVYALIASSPNHGGTKIMRSEQTVDMAARPARLAGIEKAYGVYPHPDDHTMEPRYKPTDQLHVHPGLPVEAGHYAIITFADDSVVIREVVEKKAGKVRVRQLNPERTTGLDRREIKRMERIVGTASA